MGGAGYTGGELTRLLLNHPHAEIKFVHSRSNAGKYIYEIHRDLVGETELYFTNDIADLKNDSIDLLLLCLGHGESIFFLDENVIDERIKIIDLTNDFRLKENAAFGNRNFIYGLPELNKASIKSANSIANPGCFATAIQLGLLPLAKAGLLQNVYATGITGSTGAGQSLSETSHFSWRANNIQAYKSLTHPHLAEINQSLNQVSPINQSNNQLINFVPWRGDFTRGIFISSQLKCDVPIDELNKMYKEYYSNHPFVTISEESIFLKQVINTNKCIIQLEKEGNQLVIHSAIDNLLKGACGQALQNMNLLFGFDETVGLKLKTNNF